MTSYLGVRFPMAPLVTQAIRCASAPMCPSVGECWPSVGDAGLFFHGWKPFPMAASANGGGDLFDNLLHWAANIASGVPLIFE